MKTTILILSFLLSGFVVTYLLLWFIIGHPVWEIYPTEYKITGIIIYVAISFFSVYKYLDFRAKEYFYKQFYIRNQLNNKNHGNKSN